MYLCLIVRVKNSVITWPCVRPEAGAKQTVESEKSEFTIENLPFAALSALSMNENGALTEFCSLLSEWSQLLRLIFYGRSVPL
jgi:hypothetical protein